MRRKKSLIVQKNQVEEHCTQEEKLDSTEKSGGGILYVGRKSC